MEEIPEVQFPQQEGDQQELVRFWQQVYDRLHQDHPELIERHEKWLIDKDSYGRLYAATSLFGIMNVIDSRKARIAQEQIVENDHRKLA